MAKLVQAEEYNSRPEILTGYYAYFSGLPVSGFEIFVRPGRGFAAMPTHDDLTLVVGGWPHSEFETNRRNLEKNWYAMFELAPDFAKRVSAAKRETKIVGTAVANYFRKPWVRAGRWSGMPGTTVTSSPLGEFRTPFATPSSALTRSTLR